MTLDDRHTTTRLSFSITIWAVALSWVLPAQVLGQPNGSGSECAIPATPDPAAQFPYSSHEQRCEGFYNRLLSVPRLRVVSFTAGREDYDPRATPTVSISWDLAARSEVILRVESMLRTQRYLMSASLPESSEGFEWPQDILSQSGTLQGDDLAMLAWTRGIVAGVPERVYLPVRARPAGRQAPENQLLVEILSDLELLRVSGTLARVDEQTGEERIIYSDQDAFGAPYLPFTRIRIPITASLNSGLHYLHIIAEYADRNALGGVTDSVSGTRRTATDVLFRMR